MNKATGVSKSLDGDSPPIRMRLLLDEGHWVDSELALPLWMSAHEVRTEVVLHAQCVHDAAAVYVDSIAKPCGQDGMQVLTVWSAEQDVVNAVWQRCQTLYGQGQPSWQLVGLAPYSQQHTPLNMLPYREQAAAQYSRGSWRLLGVNAAAIAAVAGVLLYPLNASVEAVVPVQVVTQSGDARDLPSLAVLRERLAQATSAQQQQAVQAAQQVWQLRVLAALARDMTAHVTVTQLMAKADLIEVHGHARSLPDLTGFVKALRTRWGYVAQVQLRDSQQQGTGVLAYSVDIKRSSLTQTLGSP
ncbi:hypothetical protein LN050_06845 [Comamonadaceae bacterium M7527]|nr:hypothetical protein LN050_06845 [Comamonadaceae bacterium M7527]